MSLPCFHFAQRNASIVIATWIFTETVQEAATWSSLEFKISNNVKINKYYKHIPRVYSLRWWSGRNLRRKQISSISERTLRIKTLHSMWRGNRCDCMWCHPLAAVVNRSSKYRDCRTCTRFIKNTCTSPSNSFTSRVIIICCFFFFFNEQFY